MAEIVLKPEVGRPKGSAASRRLRAHGKIPGVVYGREIEPIRLAVDWRELRTALTTEKGQNVVINLDVNGDRHLTIVKELQRHPVRRDVLHVDFLVVEADKPVHAEVPLVLEGEASKVIAERGVVEQAMGHITVLAKPAAIPGQLGVDISELEVGHTITVADLDLPEGVTVDIDPESPVVTASITRAVEAEVEAAEEAEVEGEAAPGEEAAPTAEAGEPSEGESDES
jgi:large subunit ribosomal protein L25